MIAEISSYVIFVVIAAFASWLNKRKETGDEWAEDDDWLAEEEYAQAAPTPRPRPVSGPPPVPQPAPTAASSGGQGWHQEIPTPHLPPVAPAAPESHYAAYQKPAPSDLLHECSCEHCGNTIEFPAAAKGMTVMCPHCNHDTALHELVEGYEWTPKSSPAEEAIRMVKDPRAAQKAMIAAVIFGKPKALEGKSDFGL